MPRGRLIFAFTARLAQIDTVAMAEDPDGTGPLVSGYDDDFNEPILVRDVADTSVTGDLEGAPLRHETMVDLLCQVEDDAFEAQGQVLGGTSPNSVLTLVFHYKNLEEKGMIDANGSAMIRTGDRLDRLIDKCGNNVEIFRNPPGLFVVQAKPGGYGIGPNRNLLIVTFEERQQGLQSSAR